MHLGNMFLFEIQGMQKSRTYEKFNFKHYHETKIPPVIGFQSNYKMPQNVEVRLNREIQKTPQPPPLEIQDLSECVTEKIFLLEKKWLNI